MVLFRLFVLLHGIFSSFRFFSRGVISGRKDETTKWHKLATILQNFKMLISDFSEIYNLNQVANSWPGKPINLYILSKYKTIYFNKIDAIPVRG